jgi:hypothetical protein
MPDVTSIDATTTGGLGKAQANLVAQIPLVAKFVPVQDNLARRMGVIFDGRAQATGIQRPAGDATLLLVTNSYHDVVSFRLPEVTGGARGELLVDTNLPDWRRSSRSRSAMSIR